MKKRIALAVVIVLVIIGILGGIKFLQIRRMTAAGAKAEQPPQTVTTAVAGAAVWVSELTAVGSLSAVQGVTVTAELPGKVVRIAFVAGAQVEEGEVLVELDTSSEQAQLPGAKARAALARSNLERAGKLLADRFISQAEYDAAVANHRQAVAEADTIRAAIGKKTIRAPFAGRLGIRQVNLGQMLQEGDAVVSLQTLDPIFVDFLLPQQEVNLLRPGLPVRVSTDTLPDVFIEGEITTLNPEVDPATRNIRVQATADNPGERLRPGMFVNVAVVLPEKKSVLVIPATAVLYAPYSNTVFVVEEKRDEETGAAGKVLRQQVVRLGEKRGDFVAVTEGLQAGDTVASTGVFKLRNGQAVVVDNTLSPDFKLAPTPENQ